MKKPNLKNLNALKALERALLPCTSLLSSFFLFLLVLGTITTSSLAGVSIAIIDSGIDVKHPYISPRVWHNPKFDNYGVPLYRDNDGYINDLYGWNFADKNNQLLDKRYVNYFGPDHEKFMQLQLKFSNNTISTDELDWVREKIRDKRFLAEVIAFGNFIHGTHVAGIGIKKSAANQVMGLKIISTKVEIPDEDENSGDCSRGGCEIKDPKILKDIATAMERGLRGLEIIKYALKGIISREMKDMSSVLSYVGAHKAQVANCSFGTGYNQALGMSAKLYLGIFKRMPGAEDLKVLINYFFNVLEAYVSDAFSKAPQTLIVFAAGNDGTDNDSKPSFPANLKQSNTISVAAVEEDGVSLAKFSNYGIRTVEVAAPGVGIVSSIPNNKYLPLSGTSQAAPYVANIAAEVINANSSLTPAEVKKIIVGTVDSIPLLSLKVSSGGVVNKNRAVRAAVLSNEKSIDDAIAQAQEEIKSDKKAPSVRRPHPEYSKYGFVLPLPSLFE